MRFRTITLPFLFVALLFTMLPLSVQAADPLQLFLNGKPLVSEIPPTMIGDYTVVPVRVVAENLGAKVGWESSTRTVTVERDTLKIALTIDKPQATVANQTVAMDIAPKLIDGNTMIPLRFIAEQMGLKVTWDGLTRSVFLFQSAAASEPSAASVEVKTASSGQSFANGSERKLETKLDTKPDTKPEAKPDTNLETNRNSHQPEPGLNGKPAIHRIEWTGDQLLVQGNGQLKPPQTFYLDNPLRLVVDIPDAELAASVNGAKPVQNGEIPVTNEAVSKIRYAQFSSDPAKVRVVMELKKKPDAVTAESQPNRSVLLSFKAKPAKRYKVVIDAGHGGHDVGAISTSGRFEKDFTLSVANKVYTLLKKEPSVEPYMTRSNDTFVELEDRSAFANGMNADLFIAIHGNKFSNATIRGTETYYLHPESLPLAGVIHKELLKSLGFPDRGIKMANFKVLRESLMPAALLEIGYLSNGAEEAEMQKSDVQEKIAASIVSALKQYLLGREEK